MATPLPKDIKFNGCIFKNYSNMVLYLYKELKKYTEGGEMTQAKNIIKILMSTKEFLRQGKNSEMYSYILQTELLTFYIDMINRYSNIKEIEVYRAVLSCIITMTDNCKLICEKLVELDFAAILINETLKVLENDFKSKLPRSITVEEIVAQLILIIHNIARHSKFRQIFIENENIKLLKTNLRQFFISKDKRMRILTMSVLTWLAEDNTDDTFFLDENSKIINNFSEFINKGMKDKGRWFEGLNVWELLKVLKTLSCMESIKRENFLTTQCISSLANILTSKNSLSNEIDICLEILWHLSFTDNLRIKLKDDFKIESAINVQTYSSNAKISDKALRLRKYFSNTEYQNCSNGNSVFDIFISYSHAQNEDIKKVIGELKGKFKVWIDTEQIKKSPLDDMAKGIEDSKVLIMGVSTSYKQSACCRAEANFAHRLQKQIIPLLMEHKYKPGGWLGLLISTERYIDVTKKNTKELIKEIEDQIKANK